MSDIKISQLPVVPNNTFNTIFPNVQGGETNQIAISGFNANDFVNVVNLGTGSTETVLTLDASLGDVFVLTYTGATNAQFSANTINHIQGKPYYLVLQNLSSPASTASVVTNFVASNFDMAKTSTTNRTCLGQYFVIKGRTLTTTDMFSSYGEFPLILY